jgi:hypothetical protein
LPPPQTFVPFPDRREANPVNQPVIERRQFGNTHSELSEEARQLGLAIDQYKLVHRRRYITYEELLNVIKSLGYRRENPS